MLIQDISYYLTLKSYYIYYIAFYATFAGSKSSAKMLSLAEGLHRLGMIAHPRGMQCIA